MAGAHVSPIGSASAADGVGADTLGPQPNSTVSRNFCLQVVSRLSITNLDDTGLFRTERLWLVASIMTMDHATFGRLIMLPIALQLPVCTSKDAVTLQHMTLQ